MKLIRLTRGLFAQVDDSDFEGLNQWKWKAQKGHKTFYATRLDGDKQFMMHRQILGLHDPLIKSDHRDGNGLNNCRSNLRAASNAQNIANSSLYSNNTSGFKGVSWNKNSKAWLAIIGVKGKARYIGTFSKKELAAAAYNEVAAKEFGEFARLNLI